MGEVRVRNLSDDVVIEWKRRAEVQRQSVTSLLRDFITREALRPRRELLEELHAHLESLRAAHGELPDSTPGIREERDRM